MGQGAEADDALFDRASRHVLDYLRAHAPMGLWAVTRVENGRQTYLTVDDAAYGLQRGGWHSWDASFCVRMLHGDAPAIAPDAQAVPAYAAAGVNDALPIGAFAGVRICDADGSLFGTICGLHPEPCSAELAALEPLLELLSRMLTLALVADRERRSADARAVQAQVAADVDVLTGVYTRRAWDRLVAEQTRAFEELADPTAVVVIDLDRLKVTNDRRGHAAGDALLATAARAITSGVRAHDPVARLGGDEFGVLLRQCTAVAADQRAQEIRRALRTAGVEASVGVAAAQVPTGLVEAQRVADEAMYEEKRRRAQQRGD